MLRGDLTIRKTMTASGATAVQVVRNEGTRRRVVKHIGSAHDESTLAALWVEAEQYAEAHRIQPHLFAPGAQSCVSTALTDATLVRVTHHFARDALLACARLCGLGSLPGLYLDLALMRMIEPASKLRTIELLKQHFDVRYAQRTVYRQLPRLLSCQACIEDAAIDTAREAFGESFHLVLYDATTLYFESFKEYDLQRPGFSKDNKPQQPQIMIGLLTTRSGFPVMHEVFEGNTFEGHTMLEIVRRFQQRFGEAKPIIVADAAMLSKDNMQKLEAHGYDYIVAARLANTARRFIDQIDAQLPRKDTATRRFCYADADPKVAIICEFSAARYRKDKREFDKQVKRARALLERNEPGRRAKFVKKSNDKDKPFLFDTALKAKTEKLLGIKGYVTNIAPDRLSDAEVIAYYKDLWHVEQAFRMSTSDLRARPIFHRTQDAIKAHVLICFMALMMGKYLEISTGLSIKRIRDELWKIHEAHVRDERTGEVHVMRMDIRNSVHESLIEFLEPEFPH